MLTRCPSCETHFRVTPDQLKTRSGQVRCGKCQQVFNALDTLIEEPVPAMTTPGVPAPAHEPEAEEAAVYPEVTGPPAPAFAPELEAPEELHALAPEAEEQPEVEAAEPAAQDLPAAADVVAPESAEPDTEPQLAAASTADAEAAAVDAGATESPAEAAADTTGWSETFPEPPPPPRRWPWALGALVALAAVGIQAALAFRVELAVLWPEGKPALLALCDIAGCEIGLPAKAALVGIESSDLHPDSGQGGRLVLTATLKNRAPFAQQFPYLELTLTDTSDKAIARKILKPADYLPPKLPVADGMPPAADIVLNVGIDPGAMTASGYRLYLFYP